MSCHCSNNYCTYQTLRAVFAFKTNEAMLYIWEGVTRPFGDPCQVHFTEGNKTITHLSKATVTETVWRFWIDICQHSKGILCIIEKAENGFLIKVHKKTWVGISNRHNTWDWLVPFFLLQLLIILVLIPIFDFSISLSFPLFVWLFLKYIFSFLNHFSFYHLFSIQCWCLMWRGLNNYQHPTYFCFG